MKTTRYRILCLGAMFCIAALASSQAFATARVLSFDFTVDGSNSYSVTQQGQCLAGSTTKTSTRSFTMTETATEDNLDGSFDFDLDQTDMTNVEDGGTPESLPSRSDTTTVVEASGKVTAAPDMDYLLNTSLISDETYVMGSGYDVSGMFISSAVDVNSTWTVQHKTTPYGQSEQTVTATATLQQWTTMNGYNVAKIRYVWTEPVRGKKTDVNIYISGSISCENIVYFAYAEKKIVKSVLTYNGRLDRVDGGTTDIVDVTSTDTTTLD